MSKVYTSETLTAVAVQFFNDYPSHTEVYITEDGQPFFEENRAILHADNNKLSYQRFVRSFESEVKIEPISEHQGTPVTENSPEYRGANPTEEEAKYLAKVKELNELKLELDSKNYQQLKSLVQFFGLSVENMKAPTLIDALTQFKQQLTEEYGTLTGNTNQ